ncbi:hypothetical protein NLU13_5401 [Sarocladium strictum]|uniref:Zn(2)-C6 fungal-type domain-containing protein n=1 Tax=Sarocladium strictum TaxID=5046 RepID=A0AA39GI49_SARSR|nr:hypothetical protein NLU13_5401 [Sarocladium strictum]
MLSSSPQTVAAAPAIPVPVPVPAPVQATKASQKILRSKKGCLTCKAKHSKCDETRPTCQRCATKGLVCGGYPSEAQWTFKHLIFQQTPGQSSNVLSSSTRPVSTTTVTEDPRQGLSSRVNQRRGSRTGSQYTQQQRRRLSNASAVTSSSLPNATSKTHGSNQKPPSAETTSQALTPVISSTAAAGPSHGEPHNPPLITSFLTDYASAFIINWFQQVCPAWSGFDSDANWNRKIAIDLWQSSAAVNSALESMSAAFLAPRNPSLRQASLRLMSRATEFIQAELQMVKNQPVLSTIPTGVMFAMFCMGTSVCWVNSRGLGLPFFRELRALLKRLNAQPMVASSRSSSELLDYFNRSMVYCDMLLAVVSDEEQTDLLEDAPPKVATHESGLARAEPDMLHPWTGISTLSSRLFAESVRLCRGSRARLRQPLSDAQVCFTATLHDSLQAQSLEEKLLTLEFNAETQQGSDTGDLATPQCHLTMTAEAYRVSALLHLYQTFPELALQRLSAATGEAGSLPPNEATLWDDWIVPLTLYLVKILEQIPPSSGSRVIQPLLYISAATGLRYSTATSAIAQSDLASSPPFSMDGEGWSWTRRRSEQPVCEFDTLTSYITNMTNSVKATASDPDPDPGVSDLSLEISRARYFIMTRLGMLETSLPPAPIVVAKELVSTIWNSYDSDLGEGLFMVHWIDVMELNDLRSMFG